MNKRLLLSFGMVVVLLTGLAVAAYLAQREQDIRQRASTPTGTTQLLLNPGSTTLTPGSQSINLIASIGNEVIDGIQAVATISGTIPDDLQFTTATISGLQTSIQTLEDGGGGTKKLTLLMITTNPQQPFSDSIPFSLGAFTFTAPDSGNMTIAFDPTLSKISENQTTADILMTPQTGTYTFAPTTTPTPSPAGGPTSTPSPSPTTTTTTFITSFTIRTRFNGVTSDRGPIPVQFYLGAMGSTTPLMQAPVSLVGDAQGFYTATFTVSPADLLPTNTTYWITIKGKKHLQRAYTNLTIPDAGVLDLTSKPQEPGDLPTQDGVVDTNDLNKVLEILAKPAQTQTDWDSADVNYDGTVNAIDLGLILTTLSVKPDEVIR